MKVSEIFETEKAPKPRPPKTLWFKDYTAWVHDIKHRYPEAEAYEDEEELIHALDLKGEKIYGFWKTNLGHGVTFASPRPRTTAIHPRNKTRKRPQ